MIKSMTGYGNATGVFDNKEISVEVKSLNSKYLDNNIKLPSAYRPKEIELRNLLTEKVIRGKVDLSVMINYLAGDEKYSINTSAVKQYIKDVESLAGELAINTENVLSAVLRLPNSIETTDTELDETIWTQILDVVIHALRKLEEFRQDEGKVLEADILARVANISSLNEQIRELDPKRAASIKQRIQLKMDELLGSENFDKNRFEQEMIYYLEKLDISEELTRLAAHCNYFKQTTNSKDKSKGKKLGFISQEIGREINTIGSKANDAEIQNLVVQAKDDLEKIKEQVLNIL